MGKRGPKPKPPSQVKQGFRVRLDDADLRTLDRIGQHAGETTTAGAIRWAIREADKRIKGR